MRNIYNLEAYMHPQMIRIDFDALPELSVFVVQIRVWINDNPFQFNCVFFLVLFRYTGSRG